MSNPGHPPRLPVFSPLDDIMNPSTGNEVPGQSKPPGPAPNGPFVPGMFQPGSVPMRPPAPGNPPGQWAGAPPRPPGVNGFGNTSMQPPQQMQHMNAGPPRPQAPPPMFNVNSPGQQPPMRPAGQMPPPPQTSQTASSFMNGPSNANMNTRMARPPVPTISAPSGGPPSASQGGSFNNTQGQPPSFQTYGSQQNPGLPHDGVPQSRPNELPVPFHGQGQYSHQVNPFMQKTPTQTPGNSAPPSQKSSRGPSPVPGSTMDALEGQFTPSRGAPSPAFPGARGSPVPGQVPAGNFPPPNQGQYPGPRPPLPGAPGQVPPQRFPPGQAQHFPPQPGLPPGPAHPPAPSQQVQPQQPPYGFGPLPPQAPAGPNAGPPPPPSSTAAPPSGPAGFPPVSSSPMGGFQPRPPSNNSSFAPPPPMSSNAPGSFPHPPGPAAPGQRYPPPPSNAAPSRYPPPPGANTVPGFPPAPTPATSQPMAQPGAMQPPSQYGGAPPGSYGSQPYGQPHQGMYANNVNAMTQNFGQMGVQDSQRAVNLLNERQLMPPDGVETAKPILPHDFKKVNCSPDIFRCTLNAIPQTSALLSKARLPLGILIHPFRDLSQLPVIQSSVIVRCRSCRTYINPFVVFVDQRRWKCNLCFRVNDLPDEFSFDPVSKTYGDPQRRPEVKSATIEFIAPSEYMLRPPQPAVYLFLLDVSFNAVETGYLSQFCQILLDELDKLPGDARTTVGFVCYDRALYYFNLAEGLSQPQMLCVPDLEEPFLPCPDNLLVNLHESKELITELLNQLPTIFEGNLETGSALGAALLSAHKMMSSTGGRVTVMQTCLPTVGPGALQNRDSGNTSGKNVTNIGPATDFYKKLSLDCSAQQIAVDLFMLNGQYADIATLSCISKYSAGCIYHFPSFHTVKNPSQVDKFENDLRRYLTRKIGFESVMRIRCTRGLSIHTFHGNFFVRSTDLLSLPNINPDAGFGMQMSIEDNLNESPTVSFQAALLYTSSKGERRIRVHTLCVPVTNQIGEVFATADQQAVAALLAKMAVDRSLNSAISDARDAMINAPVDTLSAYAQQVPASQRVGALLAPHSLRLLPMYMLAMLKSIAFSLSSSTKTDDRVFAMQQCKVQPLCYLMQSLYPHLYPLHRISSETPLKRGKEEIPATPQLQLSSANIDRTGLFLMDTGDAMYLLVGSGVGDQMCQDVFEKPNFMSIPDGMIDLPELENPTSEMIRCFVNFLIDSRPNGITFLVIRDDSKHRHLFFQHMLEDRTENSMSYYEFLQFLQGKAKG
ncbi:protein transport protein Sec24A [Aplysia californica]|uniref:Protein transport protein Sec24A n=1 Tax=Aplysia californica TaxID=6500 RepID=A0ABM0ZUL8_APLCA|nr:protein transport protein Sec24A [Aplysia californica]